jgi:DNA-binding transcriptional regulator GbsR (MarR family)
LAKEKKSKIDPKMEAMAQRIQELEAVNHTLGELVDGYNRELKKTTAVLDKTTNKLNEALDFIDSMNVHRNR